MQNEYHRLEQKINDLQAQIKTLPDGHLSYSRTGPYCKWFHINGRIREYIPKKHHVLAEQLALKKYLINLLDDLSNEQNAILRYLQFRNSHPNKSDQMLTPNSAFHSLLSPYFAPLSAELTSWASEPYETNPSYPDQLLFKCSSGHIVRSKSEEIIDMFLYFNKIPFRYEAPLQLGESLFFPDFTIRHPRTGNTYYWEHFGLMDISSYARNAYSKMQVYTSYGIYPTIQLITTFETKENPLSANIIEKIIQHYFL